MTLMRELISLSPIYIYKYSHCHIRVLESYTASCGSKSLLFPAPFNNKDTQHHTMFCYIQHVPHVTSGRVCFRLSQSNGCCFFFHDKFKFNLLILSREYTIEVVLHELNWSYWRRRCVHNSLSTRAKHKIPLAICPGSLHPLDFMIFHHPFSLVYNIYSYIPYNPWDPCDESVNFSDLYLMLLCYCGLFVLFLYFFFSSRENILYT